MLFIRSLLVLLAGATVSAQRSANTSICDFYTQALLKSNTAANQKTLLTLLVNTVIIGNYTQPNTGVKVAGILAPGVYMGTQVNMLPFFNGQLESTNRNGKAVSLNFLDGGGAAPLQQSLPANDTSSNQYFLLTHLYSFFGTLTGCSMVGQSDFPAYSGEASMYRVHAFMDLNAAQMGYFIQQVALAAQSFGVSQTDVMAVGQSLNSLFNVRCAPPATAIPEQGPQLQPICIDPNCAQSPSPQCGSYQVATVPRNLQTGTFIAAPGSAAKFGTPDSESSSAISASQGTNSGAGVPEASSSAIPGSGSSVSKTSGAAIEEVGWVAFAVMALVWCV